jgi:hypothetical protein
MTHFSLSSLRLSGAEATSRTGPPQPVLARRLGLLSLVFLLGWIPSGVNVVPSHTELSAWLRRCKSSRRRAQPYAALELLNSLIYDR